MPRVVSLFLPTWPTDRLRRKEGDAAPPLEAPLVLVGREGRRQVVLAACAAAQAAGLRVGMAVTMAQVLVPGLAVQDAEPASDAEALERLALWMLLRMSPIVAADPPDGVVVDACGVAHLHGGEQAMLASLVGRLTASGVAARAAIADSRGAAHALARHAADPIRIAPVGVLAQALAPLPVSALRLPLEVVAGLACLAFSGSATSSRSPARR
jgi:protein ImuB